MPNAQLDVNRLYFLGYRVIRNAMKNPRLVKLIGSDSWNLHCDALIISKIEKIADRQKRIARYLTTSSLERQALASLEEVYNTVNDSYVEVMTSYYNNDKMSSINIEVKNKERTSLFDKFLEDYTKQYSLQKNKNFVSNIVAVAKVVENLKATSVEIRNIARIVLCNE